MARETIGVALDDGLLRQVDRLVEDRFKNRADSFRQACRFFALFERATEESGLQKSSGQIREDCETEQVSASLAAQILEKEK
ncbi:MAG: hypothetical protein ONB44_17315 [candidate division KSB1 bacterium]|nr:hypothetical protein [candidate division KSB1 bacterium]MDZ7303896.1 hypothetical protein [candidate division KSB1 bacterium]MDZ7313180.1 hypothetical protein [candidate division KSB1 bacterium]